MGASGQGRWIWAPESKGDQRMDRLRSSPIGRQLEAYEEGWKLDHDEAMRFWDFQENLRIGIAIFDAILAVNAVWRQRVSQGLDEFSPEVEEGMRGSFAWWLQLCDQALARLEYFEE